MAEAKFKGKRFKGDPEANKRYIYNALIKDGFSHAAAAGVVGNILLETGNFKYIEEIAPNVNNQRGLGLLQWSGPRATDFEAWLSTNNKSIASVKDNVEYLLLEMKKKSRHHWSHGVDYEGMKKIEGVAEATNAFMSGYLRPNKKTNHIDQRLAYANKYDKIFQGEEPEDTNIIKGFERNVDDILRTDILYTEAGNNADKILGNIDFKNSTIGGEDMSKFKKTAVNFMLNKRIMEGKDDPYAKTVKTAFNVSSELNKPIMEEDFEQLENELTPSEETAELALGGTLQPNGRQSEFLRAEDLVAQNKTSYSPS